MFKKNETKLSWLTKNMQDIQKLTIAIIFIGGLGYTTIDWLSTKFITKLEASNYALKSNVQELDDELARTQIFVLQNELYIARKQGIMQDDKSYLRTLDKRIFVLKIKLRMIQVLESDYVIPKYLRE